MIDERRFKQYNWYNFYRDAEEAIPGDMPPPRGNATTTHCFVDADLAGNCDQMEPDRYFDICQPGTSYLVQQKTEHC